MPTNKMKNFNFSDWTGKIVAGIIVSVIAAFIIHQITQPVPDEEAKVWEKNWAAIDSRLDEFCSAARSGVAHSGTLLRILKSIDTKFDEPLKSDIEDLITLIKNAPKNDSETCDIVLEKTSFNLFATIRDRIRNQAIDHGIIAN